MQIAKRPKDEIERLEALVQYEILDTEPEREYDDIAKIAAEVCEVPVALVSFIDKNRKWHKAKVGIGVSEMKRDIAVCSHTIVHDHEMMIVEDTRTDIRFGTSPVNQSDTPVIFYAGVKLRSVEGYVLGTLCVVDHKPNKISRRQQETLKALGNQVMQLLEHRRNAEVLRKIKDAQRRQYEELEQFTHTVIHDMNSPLANLVGVADLLQTEIKAEESISQNKLEKYVGMIRNAGLNLKLFMTELLDYYKAESLSSADIESIELIPWLEELRQVIDPQQLHDIRLPGTEAKLNSRKVALRHILINLIQNAIKHNPTENLRIQVDFKDSGSWYEFSVKDNGKGIDALDQDKIFDPLTTLNSTTSGTGLGLAIVKKIVEKERGEINLTSNKSEGSNFTFLIPKK